MATVRQVITNNTWSFRVTASGATAVLVRNTSDEKLYYAVTDNDTAPGFEVALGHMVEEGHEIALQLADAERLWMSARSSPQTVTITTGPA